jgi:glycosyltransferase involved in cell wall biosynthesis
MSADVRVSVVLPVRNGERYLGPAIESVLAQSEPPEELIVVDDGSTDGSGDLARSFGAPVRVIGQPPTGGAAATNRGIAAARGALLAFIDADDLWLPDKMAWQLAALRASPDLGLVFGHVQQFVSEDLPPEEQRRIVCPPAPMPGRSALTMLATRAALAAAGAFDPQFATGYFVDWYMRAMDARVASSMLPEVVARRRLHADNYTRRERAMRVQYARLLKQGLDRRRKGEPG